MGFISLFQNLSNSIHLEALYYFNYVKTINNYEVKFLIA